MLNFLLEGETGAGDGGIWGTLIMIAIVFVFFYFFMIRPQKKQEKRDSEMRDALAVGDEVTTIGGIIGKVISIKGDTFVLETTKDKTKIRFLRGAIRSVDVKAADIAAAVIEGNQTEDAPTEGAEVVENAPVNETAEAVDETATATEADENNDEK